MLPFELTKDTPYLALSGELWSVLYEYFNRNWPCYEGFLLYHWFISSNDNLQYLFLCVAGKQDYHIQEYSFSQATLEQVGVALHEKFNILCVHV